MRDYIICDVVSYDAYVVSKILLVQSETGENEEAMTMHLKAASVELDKADRVHTSGELLLDC